MIQFDREGRKILDFIIGFYSNRRMGHDAGEDRD